MQRIALLPLEPTSIHPVTATKSSLTLVPVNRTSEFLALISQKLDGQLIK